MTATYARKSAPSRAAGSSASRTTPKTLGRAAAALSAAAAKLSADQQRLLVRHEAKLPDLMAKALAQLDEPTSQPRIAVVPLGPAEISQGEPIGERLSREEGERRLDDYARATGTSFEGWAGATAGPVEIERKLGVPRSTLHAWQAKGLVIGLVNGVRKNVFPLAQFVDGKPVAGIAEVLEVIGQPRSAWMWLKGPHPLLGGAAPLTRLKQGRLDEVLDAARTNFDQ